MTGTLEYPSTPFRICDDTTEQDRIDLLQDLAVHGSRLPEIGSLAQIVLSRVAIQQGHAGRVRAIASEALKAIQHLEYHQHPSGEWFQRVDYTLTHGGNCEDLSSALVALLMRLGITAKAIWVNQSDRPLNHVAVQAFVNNRWQWADPSISGARFGESPYQAIERLGSKLNLSELKFRAKRLYVMRNNRPAGDIRLPGPRISPTIGAGLVFAVASPRDGATMASVTAVNGTAPPDVEVSVTVDSGTPMITRSDARGLWSVSLPAPLAIGRHTILASSGATGRAITVIVGAGPAQPISIGSPQPGERTEPITEVSGTAGPGDVLSISLDASAPTSVTADATGAWSMPVTSQPSVGSHTVNVSAPDGRTASVAFIVTRPIEQPAQPATNSSSRIFWGLGAAATAAAIFYALRKRRK